ncbi:hypothetical protein TD95_002001 [Thielaviopsis punctulata]|uniref:Calcium-transporting ATPase n=1 Tax=Thielaviopsis punctulata TaxID=72032 RepID=A0A0F4ZHY3_9PEZI|nr:hypothetical protein TD95_002001 [Thielaviopsis punctulata]
MASPEGTVVPDTKPATHHAHHKFRPNLADAFTPDPNTEDMYRLSSTQFPYSPGHLSKLLNPKSLNAFLALGGLQGLEKALHTNCNTGLSPEETRISDNVTFEQVAAPGAAKYGSFGTEMPRSDSDSHSTSTLDSVAKPTAHSLHHSTDSFADRKAIYGDNTLPEKKPKSILQLAWIAYNDKVLILLTIAAIVSLALGLYETFDPHRDPSDPKIEWVEGVAILVAIIVVVFVTTLNDWQMERQFTRLNKKNNDRTVKVVRAGKPCEITVWDVMVGDVMHLETGDMIPVDGIFITGHGVKCDESSATGESDLLRKVPANEVYQIIKEADENGTVVEDAEKLDPFIISGAKVNEGTGTFLVTAVGVNSTHGRTTMSLRTEQGQTPLQGKLNGLADWIAKIGGGSALLLFIVLFIRFLARLPHNHNSPSEKGKEFMELFITAVTLVVVAVPEGLPLAVTLALAFATTRMLKDNNLVRILKACETMGNATTICSDKTGTLTQNKMTVVATTLGKDISFGGNDTSLDGAIAESSTAANTLTKNVEVSEFVQIIGAPLKKLLIQANAVNSTAFEGEQDGEHTFIGSKTEVALLTFCRDHLGAGPVQEERHNANIAQVIPFDSAAKYMATVVKLPNGTFRVYVKGASEILLSKCTRVVIQPDNNENIMSTEISDSTRQLLLKTIESYAGQTLRTISSSYRDFESWPPAGYESAEDPRDADFTKLHEDMILVSIFGIKDPLRPSVIDAIKDCQMAGVMVRMVTGDNIMTARAIATECGIYHPETGGIAMEGPDFRKLPEHKLKEVIVNLQVLARSSPEDKRILVKTLKELGETVAVTGDGTNDAPALKTADIGFSMGIAGTEVAKEASSIILMDDNFASIVKGMMWGRAVNDSVKKFLQFQLTVNVTAVVLTFVTAVASPDQESVLNAVQLLWVNLIMDTFAALALATDAPTRSVLDRKPERKSDPLITLRMVKMILGQAICQLVITFVLHFGGDKLLNYNSHSEHDETHRKTLVFNTFVWLQLFNELNNRRLDNKFNIFEGIHRNYFFLGMNIVMVGGQILIIFKGGEAFKITALTGKEWGLSIGLGAISLPWGVVIRMFPDEWFMAMIPGRLRRWWFSQGEYAMTENTETPESSDHDDSASNTGPVNGDVEANRRPLQPKRRVVNVDDPDFVPLPLRAHSTMRSNRASILSEQSRGFRNRVHDAKARTKAKWSAKK